MKRLTAFLLVIFMAITSIGTDIYNEIAEDISNVIEDAAIENESKEELVETVDEVIENTVETAEVTNDNSAEVVNGTTDDAQTPPEENVDPTTVINQQAIGYDQTQLAGLAVSYTVPSTAESGDVVIQSSELSGLSSNLSYYNGTETVQITGTWAFGETTYTYTGSAIQASAVFTPVDGSATTDTAQATVTINVTDSRPKLNVPELALRYDILRTVPGGYGEIVCLNAVDFDTTGLAAPTYGTTLTGSWSFKKTTNVVKFSDPYGIATMELTEEPTPVEYSVDMVFTPDAGQQYVSTIAAKATVSVYDHRTAGAPKTYYGTLGGDIADWEEFDKEAWDNETNPTAKKALEPKYGALYDNNGNVVTGMDGTPVITPYYYAAQIMQETNRAYELNITPSSTLVKTGQTVNLTVEINQSPIGYKFQGQTADYNLRDSLTDVVVEFDMPVGMEAVKATKNKDTGELTFPEGVTVTEKVNGAGKSYQHIKIEYEDDAHSGMTITPKVIAARIKNNGYVLDGTIFTIDADTTKLEGNFQFTSDVKNNMDIYMPNIDEGVYDDTAEATSDYKTNPSNIFNTKFHIFRKIKEDVEITDQAGEKWIIQKTRTSGKKGDEDYYEVTPIYEYDGGGNIKKDDDGKNIVKQIEITYDIKVGWEGEDGNVVSEGGLYRDGLGRLFFDEATGSYASTVNSSKTEFDDTTYVNGTKSWSYTGSLPTLRSSGWSSRDNADGENHTQTSMKFAISDLLPTVQKVYSDSTKPVVVSGINPTYVKLETLPGGVDDGYPNASSYRLSSEAEPTEYCLNTNLYEWTKTALNTTPSQLDFGFINWYSMMSPTGNYAMPMFTSYKLTVRYDYKDLGLSYLDEATTYEIIDTTKLTYQLRGEEEVTTSKSVSAHFSHRIDDAAYIRVNQFVEAIDSQGDAYGTVPYTAAGRAIDSSIPSSDIYYYIYTDEACTKRASYYDYKTKTRTDAYILLDVSEESGRNGYGISRALPYETGGTTYYIKQATTLYGYETNNRVYSVTLNADEVYDINVENEALYGVSFHKTWAATKAASNGLLTGEPILEGGKQVYYDLSGVRFYLYTGYDSSSHKPTGLIHYDSYYYDYYRTTDNNGILKTPRVLSKDKTYYLCELKNTSSSYYGDQPEDYSVYAYNNGTYVESINYSLFNFDYKKVYELKFDKTVGRFLVTGVYNETTTADGAVDINSAQSGVQIDRTGITKGNTEGTFFSRVIEWDTENDIPALYAVSSESQKVYVDESEAKEEGVLKAGYFEEAGDPVKYYKINTSTKETKQEVSWEYSVTNEEEQTHQYIYNGGNTVKTAPAQHNGAGIYKYTAIAKVDNPSVSERWGYLNLYTFFYDNYTHTGTGSVNIATDTYYDTITGSDDENTTFTIYQMNSSGKMVAVGTINNATGIKTVNDSRLNRFSYNSTDADFSTLTETGYRFSTYLPEGEYYVKLGRPADDHYFATATSGGSAAYSDASKIAVKNVDGETYFGPFTTENSHEYGYYSDYFSTGQGYKNQVHFFEKGYRFAFINRNNEGYEVNTSASKFSLYRWLGTGEPTETDKNDVTDATKWEAVYEDRALGTTDNSYRTSYRYSNADPSYYYLYGINRTPAYNDGDISGASASNTLRDGKYMLVQTSVDTSRYVLSDPDKFVFDIDFANANTEYEDYSDLGETGHEAAAKTINDFKTALSKRVYMLDAQPDDANKMQIINDIRPWLHISIYSTWGTGSTADVWNTVPETDDTADGRKWSTWNDNWTLGSFDSYSNSYVSSANLSGIRFKIYKKTGEEGSEVYEPLKYTHWDGQSFNELIVDCNGYVVKNCDLFDGGTEPGTVITTTGSSGTNRASLLAGTYYFEQIGYDDHHFDPLDNTTGSQWIAGNDKDGDEHTLLPVTVSYSKLSDYTYDYYLTLYNYRKEKMFKLEKYDYDAVIDDSADTVAANGGRYSVTSGDRGKLDGASFRLTFDYTKDDVTYEIPLTGWYYDYEYYSYSYYSYWRTISEGIVESDVYNSGIMIDAGGTLAGTKAFTYADGVYTPVTLDYSINLEELPDSTVIHVREIEPNSDRDYCRCYVVESDYTEQNMTWGELRGNNTTVQFKNDHEVRFEVFSKEGTRVTDSKGATTYGTNGQGNVSYRLYYRETLADDWKQIDAAVTNNGSYKQYYGHGWVGSDYSWSDYEDFAWYKNGYYAIAQTLADNSNEVEEVSYYFYDTADGYNEASTTLTAQDKSKTFTADKITDGKFFNTSDEEVTENWAYDLGYVELAHCEGTADGVEVSAKEAHGSDAYAQESVQAGLWNVHIDVRNEPTATILWQNRNTNNYIVYNAQYQLYELSDALYARLAAIKDNSAYRNEINKLVLEGDEATEGVTKSTLTQSYQRWAHEYSTYFPYDMDYYYSYSYLKTGHYLIVQTRTPSGCALDEDLDVLRVVVNVDTDKQTAYYINNTSSTVDGYSSTETGGNKGIWRNTSQQSQPNYYMYFDAVSPVYTDYIRGSLLSYEADVVFGARPVIDTSNTLLPIKDLTIKNENIQYYREYRTYGYSMANPDYTFTNVQFGRTTYQVDKDDTTETVPAYAQIWIKRTDPETGVAPQYELFTTVELDEAKTVNLPRIKWGDNSRIIAVQIKYGMMQGVVTDEGTTEQFVHQVGKKFSFNGTQINYGIHLYQYDEPSFIEVMSVRNWATMDFRTSQKNEYGVVSDWTATQRWDDAYMNVDTTPRYSLMYVNLGEKAADKTEYNFDSSKVEIFEPKDKVNFRVKFENMSYKNNAYKGNKLELPFIICPIPIQLNLDASSIKAKYYSSSTDTEGTEVTPANTETVYIIDNNGTEETYLVAIFKQPIEDGGRIELDYTAAVRPTAALMPSDVTDKAYAGSLRKANVDTQEGNINRSSFKDTNLGFPSVKSAVNKIMQSAGNLFSNRPYVSLEASQPVATTFEMSAFGAVKYVKGSDDSTWLTTEDWSYVSAGETVDYMLTVLSPKDADIQNIRLVDIFPYVGDKLLKTGAVRNSNWSPYIESIEVEVTQGGAKDNNLTNQFTNALRAYGNSKFVMKMVDESSSPRVISTPGVQYGALNSTYVDKITTDVAGYNWTTSGWTTLGGINNVRSMSLADRKNVRMLGLDFGNTTLPSASILKITLHCKAPDWSLEEETKLIGKQASNSFGVTALSQQNYLYFNYIEPDPVRTMVRARRVGVGDKVWMDINNNGIQDDGEPAVTDAPLILKTWYGNDALQIPLTEETGVHTTNTDSTGTYHFKDLLPSRYLKTTNGTDKFNGIYYLYQVKLGIPESAVAAKAYAGGVNIASRPITNTVSGDYSAKSRAADSNAAEDGSTEIFYLNTRTYVGIKSVEESNAYYEANDEKGGVDNTYDFGLNALRNISVAMSDENGELMKVGSTFRHGKLEANTIGFRIKGEGLPKEGITRYVDESGYATFESVMTEGDQTYYIYRYSRTYTIEQVSAAEGYTKMTDTITVEPEEYTGGTTVKYSDYLVAPTKEVLCTNGRSDGDITVKCNLTGSTQTDTDFTFSIETMDGSGNYKGYTTTVEIHKPNGSGGEDVEIATAEGGRITLKGGWYAVVKYLPVGTRYRVSEEGSFLYDVNVTYKKGTMEKVDDNGDIVALTEPIPEGQSYIEGYLQLVNKDDGVDPTILTSADPAITFTNKPGDRKPALYVTNDTINGDKGDDFTYTIHREDKNTGDPEPLDGYLFDIVDVATGETISSNNRTGADGSFKLQKGQTAKFTYTIEGESKKLELGEKVVVTQTVTHSEYDITGRGGQNSDYEPNYWKNHGSTDPNPPGAFRLTTEERCNTISFTNTHKLAELNLETYCEDFTDREFTYAIYMDGELYTGEYKIVDIPRPQPEEEEQEEEQEVPGEEPAEEEPIKQQPELAALTAQNGDGDTWLMCTDGTVKLKDYQKVVLRSMKLGAVYEIKQSVQDDIVTVRQNEKGTILEAENLAVFKNAKKPEPAPYTPPTFPQTGQNNALWMAFAILGLASVIAGIAIYLAGKKKWRKRA